MKTDGLIKALAAVIESSEAEHQPEKLSSTQSPKEESVTTSTTSSTEDQSESDVPEKKPRVRRGRGRKQKPAKEKIAEETSETETKAEVNNKEISVEPEAETIVQTLSTTEDERVSPAPKASKAKAKGRGRGRGRKGKKTKDIPAEEPEDTQAAGDAQKSEAAAETVCSPAATRRSHSKPPTPVQPVSVAPALTFPTPPNSGSRRTRKATRSASNTPTPLAQPSPAAATKTPETQATTVQSCEKRASRSSSKKGTAAAKTPENAAPTSGSGSSRKRSATGSAGRKTKKVRRGTFDKSPAKETQPTAEENKSSGTSLKDQIMAEIDMRVQQARAKSGIPTLAKPAKKAVVKNWSKTHHGAFNKMESIDDYLDRKRKRTEALSASKKPRVPGSTKPVSKPPPLSFTSPAPSRKPAIANAKSAKSVSFKVSKLKTPSKANIPGFLATTAASGGRSSLSKRQATPGARKSVSVLTPGSVSRKSIAGVTPARDRKSFGTVQGTSRKSVGGISQPFQLDKTSNTPSAKKAFNLTASLCKPLTYKPHTGKLKPFGESQYSKANVKPASNIVYAKTLMKKPHLKGQEERRKVNVKHRAQRRNESFMARRGIPGC
ncbi:uncharacterized protein [Diadema antillarum]|uniref:uncharacterized protein n=1 Tax=Diadema antillarum TaxID=105358 RepID=UPI003A87435E